MNFPHRRSDRGPIEAVLLDWAGTTMDFGCMAPALVFVEVFERKQVPAEQQAKRERACARLRQCGAHYVVDTIADILPCIDDIEARMRRGETP